MCEGEILAYIKRGKMIIFRGGTGTTYGRTPDSLKNKAPNFNFYKQSYVLCTTLGQPVIPNE